MRSSNHDSDPPPLRRQPGDALAAERDIVIAPKTHEAIEHDEPVREGTPAPPASMSVEDVYTAGARGRAEAEARLEAASPASRSARAEEGTKPAAKHAPVKRLGHGDNPNRMVAKDSSIARFASPTPEPDRVMLLAEDHPAVVEGRTLFPGTVVRAFESPRFLVSGHNNPKLGRQFLKGPWEGMPLFQLSLEERATCPRSCLQWRSCYGSSMHLARRHDHRDPDFMPALKAEIITTARANPNGFVLRLHTLGDFYSIEYVRMWADLLDALPELRIFGYTARREDADDEESRTIAKAIRWLTEQAWDVFAIRFSGQDGPQGSIVVTESDQRDSVIMCPAQEHATAACVTCGLCSAEHAREKTIGFLLHGRKLSIGPRRPRELISDDATQGAPFLAPGAGSGEAGSAEGVTLPAPIPARRQRKAEPISAEEERRLINEAIEARGVTRCAPGYARGAESIAEQGETESFRRRAGL
ncbi:MAG TPA: hypothetical protein VG943_13915 [Caulobacterales bacterium]|nr:hypothetical protein [Caulobacterales bacterium]